VPSVCPRGETPSLALLAASTLSPPRRQADILVAADCSNSGRISIWDTASWTRQQTLTVRVRVRVRGSPLGGYKRITEAREPSS
jgi:hypothetical protein